ncbi:MAG TPA: hypothetical protein VF261_00195 [Candidatus Saccharimonadales bacterium]
MKDPETAKLLLDMASIGQAKIAKKAEHAKSESEASKPAESAAKPEKPSKSAAQHKAPAEKTVATPTKAMAVEAEAAYLRESQARITHETAATKVHELTEAAAAQIKPAATKPERIISASTEPGQHPHQKQPDALQHKVALESRQVHEHQAYETTLANTADEEITANTTKPQLDTTDITQQTLVHKTLETRNAEFTEQQLIMNREQIEPTTAGIADAVPSAVSVSLGTEQLDVGREAAIAADETPGVEPTMSEILPGNKPVEPVDGTAELIADEPAVTEEAPGLEQIEPLHWADEASDEVGQEPLQICDDFSEALQSLVALPNEQAGMEPTSESVSTDIADTVDVDVDYTTEVDDVATVAANLIDAGESPATETLPDVTATVAKRLVELKHEDKDTEATALTIADVVETIRTIKVLEAGKAEPETIEATQTELEELVAVLFEQLDVEYTAKDVEAFAAILLRPDFQPSQPAAAETNNEADLEHDGTHEAKFHFLRLAGSITDAEDTTQHFLGELILLYMMPRKSRSQMLVY